MNFYFQFLNGLSFSFVKDIYVVGDKLARNGRETAICLSQILVISL